MRTLKPKASLIIPALNALSSMSPHMRPGRANMLVCRLAESLMPIGRQLEAQIKSLREEFVEVGDDGQPVTKLAEDGKTRVFSVKAGREHDFERETQELLDTVVDVSVPEVVDADLDRIESAWIGDLSFSLAPLLFLFSTE